MEINKGALARINEVRKAMRKHGVPVALYCRFVQLPSEQQSAIHEAVDDFVMEHKGVYANGEVMTWYLTQIFAIE